MSTNIKAEKIMALNVTLVPMQFVQDTKKKNKKPSATKQQ